MPAIQSRDNPRLKEAARLLASARERRKSGRCVLEGAHLVEAFVARGGHPDWLIVDQAAVGQPEIDRVVAAVAPSRVLLAPTELFAEATHLASPARLLAVAPTPRAEPPARPRFALLLEDVQDPGNVGTILRSAAAAGVDVVYLSPGCAFAWSPKVLRAGQGAHFHLHLVEDAELVTTAGRFEGRVYGAVAGEAPSIFEVDLSGAVAFAIGSEGAGLSSGLLEACSGSLTIPMPGRFESLNAAVAASVCLFEKVRRQLSVPVRNPLPRVPPPGPGPRQPAGTAPGRRRGG